MSEDNQRRPLAPPSVYGRSDEESAAASTSTPYLPRQETSSKCIVYVLLAIVIISTILLIFSSAFLRVDTPSAKLNSVAIENLRYDNSSLTVTMNAVARIKNTNFGRFVLANGGTTTAIVLYDGAVIGRGGFGGGTVKSRGAEVFGFTMDVESGGVLDSNQTVKLGNDFNSGILELVSFAKLSGKVHLLDGSLLKRVNPVWNCTMNLNLSSKLIQDLVCN